MKEQKHIINSVNCEVEAPNLITAYYLKDTLDVFLKEEVFPEINTYFDSLMNKSKCQILRLNLLTIDVNLSSSNSIKELKYVLLKAIKKQINTDIVQTFFSESSSAEMISYKKSKAEAFIHFVSHGSYPWWFEDSEIFTEKTIDKLLKQPVFVDRLQQSLKNEIFRKRLIYQFNPSILKNIILQFTAAETSMQDFQQLKKTDDNTFHVLDQLLKIISVDGTLELKENLKFLIKEKVPQKNLTEKADVSIVPSEELLIKNAGLIILHPFLNQFFENLGFISEKRILPHKIHEAIHVLHYLACKKEQPFEYELIFEKYLCNVPLNEPIKRDIHLSEAQKKSCEELLEAVLEHWTALKSSSIAMLRNEFLMREGKLSQTEEKQKIFIQRKSYDLLLDKLPWNISLIKIPWKRQILFVDW